MDENEIRKSLSEKNEEFRTLLDEHKNLNQLIEDLNTRVYLTPDEEMERKRIQKQKLQKKDRIAEMVRQYKSQNVN